MTLGFALERTPVSQVTSYGRDDPLMKDLRRSTQDLSHFKREITDALGQKITIRKGEKKKQGLLTKWKGEK